MAPQTTSTSPGSRVESLDDWETIEAPTTSENETPPHETKTLIENVLVSKSAQRSKGKSRYGKKALREQEALREQMQQLDLGPSEIAITPSASGDVAVTSKTRDAASLSLELGYAGNVSNLPRSMQIAINNRLTRQDLTKFKEEAELNFTHALPYFFSGSFIFPSCLRSIVDGTTLLSVAKSMTPATLRGYKRFAVWGQPYPAMLPSTHPDDAVTGMLVFGMFESQRRAIHRYENGMFDLRRTKVEIELEGGEMVDVETGVYVWNREATRLVDPEVRPWRVEDLLESSWFNANIEGAAEEEKLLEQVDAEANSQS